MRIPHALILQLSLSLIAPGTAAAQFDLSSLSPSVPEAEAHFTLRVPLNLVDIQVEQVGVVCAVLTEAGTRLGQAFSPVTLQDGRYRSVRFVRIRTDGNQSPSEGSRYSCRLIARDSQATGGRWVLAPDPDLGWKLDYDRSGPPRANPNTGGRF